MKGSALVLLGFFWLTPALAREEASQPTTAEADREVLVEIVRQHSVATRPEQPGLGRYAQDVIGAGFRWLSFRLERLAPGLAGWVVMLAKAGAQVIAIVALAFLTILGLRWLRARYFRSRTAESPAVVPLTESVSEPVEGRSREAWEGDLRRRLDAGDVAGACEALWWWLARAISRGPVESSWTSRELLTQARRRDLAPPVRRLDRMIYGAAAPSAADVRRLWAELEEAVG